MDKQTLSNYGWIVIAILVLVVMIALATPFGNYIRTAVENTVNGLFAVEQNAISIIADTVRNQTTGEMYSTLDKALENAKDGDRISMGMNATIDNLVVPNNVTLDLNGHSITTQTATVNGTITDSKNGTGVIIVAKDKFTVNSTNNQMPLYDATINGYHLFDVKLSVKGVKNVTETSFMAGMIPFFTNKDAYTIISTSGDNGGIKVLADITLSINGSIKTNTVAFSDKNIKNWATTQCEVFAENYALTLSPTMNDGQTIDTNIPIKICLKIKQTNTNTELVSEVYETNPA